ncbi:hypothetical protein WJX81_008241 [Elliptochloris bilobata]|uniref:Uncharacterized protein n=1 Tax=Elliptochloris bilobata TaxID=381761 RepID=A0AAW1RGG4_9CHLO
MDGKPGEDADPNQPCLDVLEQRFFQRDYGAVLQELGKLPPGSTQDTIEGVADACTAALEAVSEGLSQHVLRNYVLFVAGIAEVSALEADLIKAHVCAKEARANLGLVRKNVAVGTWVAKRSRRKQARHFNSHDRHNRLIGEVLVRLLDGLSALHQAAGLQAALKEAREAGAYAQAFWLCARCSSALAAMPEVHSAQAMLASVAVAHEDTVQRLSTALTAACADFQPERYTQVLEGYVLLGQDAAVMGVVRSVLLTRPGAEGAHGGTLQELVRRLPGDLFRTCLARALMVTWDVLASHEAMRAWHTARLTAHAADLAALRAARMRLHARLATEPNSAPRAPAGAPGGEGLVGAASHKEALQELQEVELREAGEQEWGDAMGVVAAGLRGGRRLLWDEVARRVGALLASPAAWEGEHFLQVAEWVARILAAGDAFAGVNASSGLRALLAVQAGNFFRAYHASVTEALLSMLRKEQWQRLPPGAEGVPSLAQALRRSGTLCSGPGSGGVQGLRRGVAGRDEQDADSEFAAMAAGGNPWRARRRRSPKQRPPEGGPWRLGFGGSAGPAGEDRASRRLDVDSRGLPRRVSDDIWSRQTSRRTSDESEATGGARSLLSEEDVPELWGDYIDEDAQRVMAAGEVGGGEVGDHTNSSLRLMRWLRDYGELMRALRPASFIFAGLCELFDMYLVAAAAAFIDVPLVSLSMESVPQETPAAELPVRLRGALARALAQMPAASRSALTLLAGTGRITQGRVRSASAPRPPRGGDGGDSPGGLAAASSPGLPGAAGLPNSGASTGACLAERGAAAASLAAAAAELGRARADLAALLPAAEGSDADELLAQTLAAAGEAADCILRAGARRAFPTRHIAERLAMRGWDLAEPPGEASEWVEELKAAAEGFRAALNAARGLSEAAIAQLWAHAAAAAAAAVVDGTARVRGRCSAIGRHAIAADLVEATHALRTLAPRQPAVAAAVERCMHVTDTYIKAFFITDASSLGRWAAAHAEYRPEQHAALACAVADFKGLRKRDRAVFIAAVEQAMIAAQLEPA